MKRNLKQGTGLYGYLESIGVLANGTGLEIEQAKKVYWSKYRKEWKKSKRQQSKTYVLFFSFADARRLSQKAITLCISPTKLLKQAALSGSDTIGPVLIGKIREQIVLYSSFIETITVENQKTAPIKDMVLDGLLQLEQKILTILSNT